MKRAIISLVLLVFALVGVAVTAVAEYHPASSSATIPTGTTPHQLRGYAGKIIAVKPPGDWAQGGGATVRPAPFSPLIPNVLPVFGTDVNVAASNETFIASNPQNPLYFIAG